MITFYGLLGSSGPRNRLLYMSGSHILHGRLPCFLFPLIFPHVILQAIVAAKARNELATGSCVECLKWLVQITMLEDGSEKKADLVHLFLCVILGALDTSVPTQVRQVRLQSMHQCIRILEDIRLQSMH